MINKSGENKKIIESNSDSKPIHEKSDKKLTSSTAAVSPGGSSRKMDNLTNSQSIEIPIDNNQNLDAVSLKDRNITKGVTETEMVQESSSSLAPESESWLEKEFQEKRVILKAFWDQRIMQLNQESVNMFKDSIIQEHFPQSKEWENQIEQLFSDAVSGKIEFDVFFDALKFVPWWPILGMDNSEKLEKPTLAPKEKVEKPKPEISGDDINKVRGYMQERGMSGAVCLGLADGTLVSVETPESESAGSYSIHSLGKIFTGMLALLMVREGIISKEDLEKPVQLDESVLEALKPYPQVIERLKEVSLHQLMTHEAGLGNYLGAYIGAIVEGKNLEMRTPNDFLQFAEDEVFPVGKYRYSNLGILIVGLAIQHAYEKKHGPCEYHEILKKYIIDKVGIPSFSLSRPENAKFNPDDPIAPNFEGSPAGGYWMTAEDLGKFGHWIYTQTQEDPALELLMQNYGQEFYNAENQEVFHTGDVPSASAILSVSLKTGAVVAVLSDQPRVAFDLNRVVQDNVF